MIRIMIVEDSRVVGILLKAIFDREEDMTVIGHALNGQEAVKMVTSLKPDLITMDIRMPLMDGFEAASQIMSTIPTPIVVVSSSVKDEELKITFRAIEEGALAVIEKPKGIHHPDFQIIRGELVDTIRAMAEVKLVRRIHRQPTLKQTFHSTPLTSKTKEAIQVVALACSTGGPQALHTILSTLPILSFPILVTQHISPGFIGGLRDWLDKSSQWRVKLAEDRESLQAGTVYLAPDDWHLQVKSKKMGGLHVHLSNNKPVNGFRPSGTPLFQSLSTHIPKHSVGGILTGMGNDGAVGLLAMKQVGCPTFVQDQASSIVFGMPKEALVLGAADLIFPLEHIATHILSLDTPVPNPKGYE